MELNQDNGGRTRTRVGVPPTAECLAHRMGTSRFGPKLAEQQRYELVQQLAAFKSVPEVQRFAKDEWGIELTTQTIRGYLNERKWTPLIERIRQEWAAGIVNIAIAHKRYRLENLQQLLEKIEANPNLSDEKKEWRILRILDQARREMEEAKTNFTNLFMTQIQQYSYEELLKRRDELIAKVTQWKLPDKTINVQPAQGQAT